MARVLMPGASVTFLAKLRENPENLVRKNKVSIVWLVGDAVEGYVADTRQVFARSEGDQQP